MSDPLVVRLAGERVALDLLPLGATLHRYEVRTPEREWRNLVVSRPDVTATDDSYFGATVGRLANRVGNSHLVVDGVGYSLPPNEGPHHLHGGPGGLSEVVWDVVSVTDDEAVFHLVSPDGDQGYPGTLDVTARFSLIDGGAQVVYTATTDATTVVNLTTHPYFILGDGTVEDHVATVPASHYTVTRDDLIPTGEILGVEGTALDLRSRRVLGEVIAAAVDQGLARKGGIDQNFVTDGEGMREQIRLTGPSGITLVVRSDAPAVQLYSAEHLGRIGLAIEPQGFPDAPNHPGFPSVVLRPGETYTATTQWLVS